MNDVWLTAVDAAVLGALVVAYLLMRQALVAVAATTTAVDPGSDADDEAGDEGGDEGEDAGDEPGVARHDDDERMTGVLRRGHLLALFVVVRVDADTLAIRSRPRWLGLGLIVPRADVATAELVQPRKGAALQLVLHPVPDRAVGLERFRLQLRGDATSVRRSLTRRGWLARATDDRRGSGRPGRSGRPSGGGRTTPAKSKPRR